MRLSPTKPRTIGLLAALWLSGPAGTGALAEDPDRPPNIVMIVADDLGYRDLGFMGSPYAQTPNLDRLAREGTVFPNGFSTASRCKPALRSLLTGLHPYQWDARIAGIEQTGGPRPDAYAVREFTTLPSLLAERGYASFQAGKFWEKSYTDAGFTHGLANVDRPGIEPIIAFMDEHKETPFFVWFAPKLPHIPHDASARLREPYQELGLSPFGTAYYANIARLDEMVGKLLDQLEQRGLDANTLVVFLSDNGWDQVPTVEPARRRLAWDGPKGKSSMYELGFRTPIVIRGASVRSGEVDDSLVSIVDLFPTLLEFADAQKLPDRPGKSLRPALEGRPSEPREFVIGGMPTSRDLAGTRPRAPTAYRAAFFFRDRHWWYVWRRALRRDELYDLRTDPLEENDVAARESERVAEFRRRIEAWTRELRRRPRSSGSPDGQAEAEDLLPEPWIGRIPIWRKP